MEEIKINEKKTGEKLENSGHKHCSCGKWFCHCGDQGCKCGCGRIIKVILVIIIAFVLLAIGAAFGAHFSRSRLDEGREFGRGQMMRQIQDRGQWQNQGRGFMQPVQDGQGQGGQGADLNQTGSQTPVNSQTPINSQTQTNSQSPMRPANSQSAPTTPAPTTATSTGIRH
jgi:hypothetical protein